MGDPSSRELDAHAAAFAQILATTDDAEVAFRQAVQLADGLFAHQVEGVAFLLGRKRAILADDMGLGKTRQAIVALQQAAPDGPVLIVCPASVKRNWAREISLAGADGTIHIIDGTTKQRVPRDARWVIANYDILGRHVDAVVAMPWAGLVFDEAHYLKNHTSARSKLAREIAGRAAAKATKEPPVYLLTGTPMTNRPRDLFVLLQLVGHPLGRSFLSFAKRYCAAEKTQYGWKTDGASNLEELTVQLHGTMLRRAKEEVISLPPKLRTWLPTTDAKGIAIREVREVMELLVTRVRGASEASDQRSRTRLLALLTVARRKLAVAKYQTTLDLARGAIEQGEKVIVFSCFDEPLQRLAKAFGPAAVVVTGKVASGKRQPLVDRFQQDDDVRVFLANIIAGGTGLNLTAATQVIFNDLDWVPANHWQAEDRAYRLGQTRTVNVTYVVGVHTLDEFVQAVLETKTALVRSVVEGEALFTDDGGAVLEELERAIAALSPGLADAGLAGYDEGVVDELVRAAAEQWRKRHGATGGHEAKAADPAAIRSLRAALQVLARVLEGPRAQRFQTASASKPGSHYFIDVDGSDVTCSCPGFEYRGQCKHSRDVKNALASGKALPAEYAPVT
ncbi:MAG TPA: SNF2-related protein [Vicinamibacterales bacterium]|nr:SNF2-related protein [Vicinamibacterales bacterium]